MAGKEMRGTIPAKGNERSALKLLNKYVRTSVSGKWHDLGLELLEQEDEEKLNEIENNNPSDTSKCCTKMFQWWLSKYEDKATWNQLIKSLREVELSSLANKIEEMLTPLKDTVGVSTGASQLNQRTATSVIDQQQSSIQSNGSDDIDMEIFNINFNAYEDVSDAFAKLFSVCQKVIKVSNEEFKTIKNSCVARASKHFGGLIKRAPDTHCLFEILADNNKYCNWMNVSFLNTMAIACGNKHLQLLIKNYKDVIYSKKLREVWNCFPHYSVRGKYYSKLQATFGDKDPDNMTVEELVKSEPQLAKEIGMFIAVVQCNSLLVTWLIPTDEVYQTYLSFLTVPQQSRKDELVQFATWMAYPPQNVMNRYEKEIDCEAVSLPTLLTGYYHGLLLRDIDADLLIDKMCSIGLLSANELIVISSGHTVHQRNLLLLEYVRHMDLQLLLKFCKLLEQEWPEIGSQLITTLGGVSCLNKPKPVTSVLSSCRCDRRSTANASIVVVLYFHLIDQLGELLQSYDYEMMMEQCRSLKASDHNDIKLFSHDQLMTFSQYESTTLLRMICLFTWSNCCILKSLVNFCSKAVELLEKFESCVDPLQPIISYPIPCLSSDMFPNDTSTYTILAVRYKVELYECSLQCIYDVQSVMIEKCDITQHCLQLLAVRSDPTILYWTIPKCVVHLFAANVPLHSEYLYSKGILEVLVYPDLLLTTDADVCFGSRAFDCTDAEEEILKKSIIESTNNNLGKESSSTVGMKLEVIEKDKGSASISHQQDVELDELPSKKKIKLGESAISTYPVHATNENTELPQIEREITCLICGEFFTNPITISCSHTFCRQCIINSLEKNKLKNIVCCPICCEVLLQNDVESIPINFSVKSLIKAYRKKIETNCANCEQEGLSVVWCTECNKLYCQNCNEMFHKKWKDFKMHRVVDFIHSSSEICNTHFKPLDFYCETCSNVMCQECTINHPFETHDFYPIDTSTVASKEKDNIKQVIASLEQLLNQIRSKTKSLEHYENSVDSEHEIDAKQIKIMFEKSHELLTCTEKQLLQNSDFNKLSMKQTLIEQKRNAILLEIQLEGCKKFTENVVTANRTQQIQLYHHWIMRRVNHLSEQVRNVNCDLQSHKLTTALSAKSEEFISPLCYMESVLYLPYSSIHVCTPVVKPKQVKLMVVLRDILGYPISNQFDNIRIRCNMEDNFLRNIQVKEQPDKDGVYHICYSVKKKIYHFIFVYLGDILVNHEKVEVSVNTRDYVSINKSEIKIIKNGLPETPLKFPYSLAKGPNNQLIVGDDYTSRLVIFDDQLQYSHCIEKRGKENGEFLNITGIAVDNHEQLYVADSDLNCIQKFKLGGEFIYKFGSYGSDNGQFNSPHGLLVSGSKLFVCDRHNHRIQVFIHGEWSYTIGQQGTEPGSFKEPIDLSLSNNEDQIFVTDNKNHRVQIFALDGQFLRVFGNLQGIPSTLQKNPVGVFVTSDGYVLITCCHGTGSIMVLDEDGTFVSAIEGSYQGKRIFNHPCGIVMMDNGKIIIACNLSNKLVVL